MSIKTKKNKIRYTCQSCGYVSLRWMGHCSECHAWNSFVEETVSPDSEKKRGTQPSNSSPPINLSEVTIGQQQRIITKSQEFNRVLGGGIVYGSVALLGGDPGIGKSTLLLQEGVAISQKEVPVLFVSGEESVRQTKLRAKRLEIDSDFLYVLAETDVNEILGYIENLQPKLVIVDSIQTVYQPAFESSPGSISQVRECALEFLQFAKKNDVPVILVGHVTKEGYIAGPKVLEHMVDVLLQFEGDRDHFYRILRTVKNRFGSTREIGVFEMTDKGLREVTNPSAQFLEQRKEDISGTSVTCTMEGTRPFLVEIQALVSPTSYGLPQRTTTGIDSKRLSLLLAVLEKRLGLRLGAYDVFVNAAGGVRIDEPSADLGILMSIASSFKDQIVDSQTVIIGEVGLGGEIRTVPQIDKRLAEASKLGFKKAVIPKFNLKALPHSSSLKITSVDKAEDALEEVLV
ncbi:MAG: DNA repair protein RadA [bacterium]